MTSYTITGPTRLPDDSTAIEGTWAVYFATLEGTALGSGGGVRAGVYEVATDPATGLATATVPASGPDDAYIATFRAKHGHLELGPFGPFQVTKAMTWGEVINIPVLADLTPSQVAQAAAAATAAASSAAAAQGAAAAAQGAAAAAQSAAASVPTMASLATSFAARWRPNTAYLAGDAVLNPAGDIVTAKVNFTSGSTYSAANWNLSTSYAYVPDHIDISPASLAVIQGTPNYGYVSGIGAGMMFDGASASGATDECVFVGVPIPADWTAVTLVLYWTVAAVGTVRWKTYVSSLPVGSLWSTGASLTTDVAMATGATGKQLRTVLNANVAVTPGSIVTVRIDRLASSSVDTLNANDACLQMVQLLKAA